MYPFNEDYRDALKYQIHDYALSGTIGNKTFLTVSTSGNSGILLILI